jgi:hypothetical protein
MDYSEKKISKEKEKRHEFRLTSVRDEASTRSAGGNEVEDQ